MNSKRMCNCNLHARYVFDVSELYIWNQMGAVYVSADFLNSLCELNCKLIYLVDGTLIFGLLFWHVQPTYAHW